MSIQLDKNLQKDCYRLAESDDCLWLLLNNRYFLWMVIVPNTTQTELYRLTGQEQQKLTQQSNLISEFISQNFACDKLNVASIGNIVAQMHLHIIARTTVDPCWPGVVWGTEHKAPYPIDEVLNIQSKLQQFCLDKKISGYHFTTPEIKPAL
ncbi:MAG: diadenosine tetraphosphate (Ap4A) HIT family hydrolase [Psychromonas sp.]|jgi:diadenosine tetraphosphate (Ap4A) HIT family hydrolase|uniref:HIT family protein n=1 Tax=Psychromonas sp. TaxID=1884585 RepID=UPI0039E339B8